jgi:hypothetical protein
MGVETATIEGEQRCIRCFKKKSLVAFCFLSGEGCKRRRSPRYHSWCRSCVRIADGERRQTEEYRTWMAAYLNRPDVRERRARADRKRSEKRRAYKQAINQTVRGKLMHCRRQARISLAKATTDERRRHVEVLIASYTREIDRLDRQAQEGNPPALHLARP